MQVLVPIKESPGVGYSGDTTMSNEGVDGTLGMIWWNL
jgi:hypothetical protein